MKKIVAYLAIGVVLVVGVFFVLFMAALRQGPSIETLTKRICQSLRVSPSKLSFMGGSQRRDPTMFFMLSDSIPEGSDVQVLKGWTRDHNGKLFNQLATNYQIPCTVSENDILLNYKGDVFDLYITKVSGGCCILYYGF